MSDAEIVADLCEIERGMSEWEVEFVESLAKQVRSSGYALTARQREKALEILERLQ